MKRNWVKNFGYLDEKIFANQEVVWVDQWQSIIFGTLWIFPQEFWRFCLTTINFHKITDFRDPLINALQQKIKKKN